MAKLDSTVQWDEAASENFGTLGTTLFETGHMGDEAIRRGQMVVNLLRSLPLSRRNMIEVGCGNGWLAERLVALGL